MLLFLGRCLRCFQGFGSLHGGMEASHPFGPTNEGKRPAKSLLAPTGSNFLTVNSCFSQSSATFLSSSAPEQV